jgi:hypothetical protein
VAYGNDVTVFVEDKAGDQGAPASPAPWWLSPDVDIPANPGLAVQGRNEVQIRVHAHEEPLLADKIVAEVYVGEPSLVMSPTTATVRIDPGNLRFRSAGVSGSEPVADIAGATLSFPWTPSSSSALVDGPGHRCLVVRAFPENVTPPSSPFDVPNEQHEAQRNLEVLTTTMAPGRRKKGDGTPEDPRRRDRASGMWLQALGTLARGKRGRRFVVVAFDPRPDETVAPILRPALPKGTRFADKPPGELELTTGGAKGAPIKPGRLLGNRRFAARSGVGRGVFREDLLLSAVQVELGPRRRHELMLRFDHTNLGRRGAAVLHVAQWDEAGVAEGGITVVLPPPLEP